MSGWIALAIYIVGLIVAAGISRRAYSKLDKRWGESFDEQSKNWSSLLDKYALTAEEQDIVVNALFEHAPTACPEEKMIMDGIIEKWTAE